METPEEDLRLIGVRYKCGEYREYEINLPPGVTLEKALATIEAESSQIVCPQCRADEIVEGLRQ